ncbi:MAG: hypothetical protein KJ771_06645 [Nanoarchaeota archaeon]|nr:hypothetical protein [Nanoarchaeota archaeon]
MIPIDKNIIQLINDIKNKKELKEISDDFVYHQLLEYFNNNSKLAKSFSFNKKSKQYKEVVKKIRAKLRRIYGLFRESEDVVKRSSLVDLLLSKKTLNKKIITDILTTHSSTKERLPFYEDLYKKIFKITKQPKSILDLGAGINPFSIPLMKLKSLKYYASDLSQDEVEQLNTFFKYLKKKNKLFTGKAELLNILHFVKLPQADLAFLFKMTDVLDQGKNHKTTEQVIKKIPAKFVVVSFPTKTMSGKKMNFPRRKWIELMCKRLKYSYKVLTFSNEIFYVIKKLNII